MPLDHETIKLLRHRRKLTAEQAAAAAGMPRPHWSRIEAGVRPNPSLDTAERVAAALGVKIEKILKP
jgi:transcriptional regulator with XRE-family HTH domain